jgi:hypothetical protein
MSQIFFKELISETKADDQGLYERDQDVLICAQGARHQMRLQFWVNVDYPFCDLCMLCRCKWNTDVSMHHIHEIAFSPHVR